MTAAPAVARTPVWLDCDPGHDDSMALILAGHSPSLRLIGVSTVAGNQTLEKTTRNALNILHVSGLGFIPVVAGAARPLLRPARYCPEVHGDTGLDALGAVSFPPLPADRAPAAAKAISYIATACRNFHATHKQRVHLIATGCMTNVALLLSVYPEVAADLCGITAMAGAFGRGGVAGNTGPVAEFNVQVDPEAAAMVLASCHELSIPLTLVPLDVTHTVCVTPPVLACVQSGGDDVTAPAAAAAAAAASAVAVAEDTAAEGAAATAAAAATPFRALISGLLQFFSATYRTVFELPYPPLHDPVAVYAVIAPEAFTTRTCRVDVETASPLSFGQTVADFHNVNKYSESAFNARVCLALPCAAAFWRAMLGAIAVADTHSVLNAEADIRKARVLAGMVAPVVSPGAAAAVASSPGAAAVAAAVPVPVLHPLSSPVRGSARVSGGAGT